MDFIRLIKDIYSMPSASARIEAKFIFSDIA
jgi:hypothetical protein